MRSFVLLVMIALLPLRMWAAEGMATRMAQADVVSAAATSMAMGDQGAMPDDCPMMAKAESGTPSSDESESAPQAHCMACHLCASSASQVVARVEAGPAPTDPPLAPSSHFASAEARRDHKPPIS